MNSKYLLTFGKHKGEALGDVPASYLFWLADQKFCPEEVRVYVKENQADLLKEEERE